MKRNFEIIGVVIAFMAVIIALLTWLYPYDPIGNSSIATPDPKSQSLRLSSNVTKRSHHFTKRN